MSITLPKLPERPWQMFCTKCGKITPLDAKDVQHSPLGPPFASHFGVCPCGYQAFAEQAPWTADQLHDRDIEVARLVLEAAAKEFDRRAPPGTGFYTPEEPAEIIRALEVRHHE